VNDGAAALIIASEKMALAQGLVPRTRIVAMATAGVEPRLMGLGPVPATRKVLERAGLSINDMDVIELNEAFASQALGVLRQLGLPDDAAHVNPNGGDCVRPPARNERCQTGAGSEQRIAPTQRALCALYDVHRCGSGHCHDP
jgi:hypothetical protein